MFTRPGDVYDQTALERDFNSLWNTGYFDDLRIEREASPKGWRIHVYVKEKPTIREIKYVGLSSVSQSDVLDKFKERKVGLTQESQYDPTKVKRAEVVIKELLAAHGRQFATVTSEVRPIPPAAVGLTFVVKEGPKVKVGKITFEGNKAIKSRELQTAMKNLKPIGIPHSIFLESLFSKTYDSTKLNEDAERVRYYYQTKGYFKALVADPKTKIRDTPPPWYWPFNKKPGKAVDITMPVEEGQQYRLKEITFTGNKAVSDTRALRAQFKIKDGDIFDSEQIRKGLENLRKAYAALGYINFSPVPNTDPDDEKRTIALKIDLDEGKQFYVRRIEFQGNTTTRDKVIRRELALEEGQVYNGNLWELSLLRLNQLQYFEVLKPEQDSEIKQNTQDATVDILLKVREKGKNSIGLTGGVSGLYGGFIGVNYTTNNLFGKGESLTLAVSVGQYQKNYTLSFTQPYLLDKPLQFSWTVYHSSYNYNQEQQLQVQNGGQNINLPASYQALLQNYTQTSTGFSTSLSYPLKRSFKRVGITYSFDDSTLQTYSAASTLYFEALAFRGLSGPNSLTGIQTSKIVPNFSFNRIDNPQRPHSGQSLFIATEIAGIGGNTHYFKPVVEWKKFRPMNKGRNTLGFRVQGSWISGYAGDVAPPFDRFYMGGDQDLRGFDIRAVSPVTLFPTAITIPLQNPDGTTVPLDPSNPRRGTWNVTIPVNQIIFPGGDTSWVANLEYRVPIVGPVTLAPFVDMGMDFITNDSQLRIADQQVITLNATNYGCPYLNLNYSCAGTSRFPISGNLQPVSGTNYQPRMSTGLELQVVLPVVNAPFRIYYAYNPMRLDQTVPPVSPITRSMFPAGAAGDYTYANAAALYNPGYLIREPRKTFRFTVATTF
jgi:outer membrane protein insertion porin family